MRLRVHACARNCHVPVLKQATFLASRKPLRPEGTRMARQLPWRRRPHEFAQRNQKTSHFPVYFHEQPLLPSACFHLGI